MPILEELIALTKHLRGLCMTQDSKQSRDDIIKEVHRLLDERSHIIPLVETPFSTEEMEQVKTFMRLNQETEEKMQTFLADLKHDMHTSKLQRKSNQSYVNPYNHIQTADGMYVDRKK